MHDVFDALSRLSSINANISMCPLVVAYFVIEPLSLAQCMKRGRESRAIRTSSTLGICN